MLTAETRPTPTSRRDIRRPQVALEEPTLIDRASTRACILPNVPALHVATSMWPGHVGGLTFEGTAYRAIRKTIADSIDISELVDLAAEYVRAEAAFEKATTGPNRTGDTTAVENVLHAAEVALRGFLAGGASA